VFSYPEIEEKLTAIHGALNLSLIVQQIQDPTGYAWYYRLASRLLLDGLWGKMAGNLIPLPGSDRTYRVSDFLGMVIFALSLFTWFGRSTVHTPLHNWLLAAFLVALAMVLLRGSASVLWAQRLVVPYIRYLLPGFLPLAWFFALGLSRLPLSLSLSGLAAWGLLGVYAISKFYHPVFVTPFRFAALLGLGLASILLFLFLWEGKAHADRITS
jgi:hypothetical protein